MEMETVGGGGYKPAERSGEHGARSGAKGGGTMSVFQLQLRVTPPSTYNTNSVILT